MSAVLLIVMLLSGRLVSLAIYQSTWRHQEHAKTHRGGLVMGYLLRARWWPLHAVWFLWAVEARWDSWPMLYPWAVTACWILAVSAIGRMGVGHHGRFFWWDRLLILSLAIGSVFAPGWIYPCMLAACCVQYAGAGWRLSPGYSNLLGFEFVRGSLGVLAGCWMLGALAGALGHTALISESLIVAVVIAYQAGYYMMQALSKSALGRHWWSWVFENRVACLLRNAHLRGWCPTGWRKGFVLGAADWFGRMGILACACVWILEFGWLAVLVDPRVAVLWWCLSIVFHIAVFLLTGLLAWQFVVSHAAWCLAVMAGALGPEVFTFPHACAAGAGALIALAWVAKTRVGMLKSCRAGKGLGGMRHWSDAADLLMAWWDGPLMRFYSWEGETMDGRKVSIPVTAFSPHDTAITDLPTHLMILGLHQGLDPRVGADRELAQTGVWGLLIDLDERDFLYRLMDRGETDPQALEVKEAAPAWESALNECAPREVDALREVLENMNKLGRKWWQRCLMRWPHFPGEDLVPDICPLVTGQLPRHRFDEPLRLVRIRRVRTWQDQHGMHLLENSLVGTIWLEPKEVPS